MVLQVAERMYWFVGSGVTTMPEQICWKPLAAITEDAEASEMTSVAIVGGCMVVGVGDCGIGE